MSSTDALERVRIGPAGWSYDDWKGRVYPEERPRDFDPLAYLARYFDVIEVNSSFYRPPPRRWTRSWARRVADNPRFRFTAKLWRRFTHERDEAPEAGDVAAVREGFDALAEEDRLAAVLVQFPWSFKNGPEEREWLEGVVDAFDVYPLAVEVRHDSWDDPDALEWLADRGVGLASIDQPLHDHSLGPVVRRTGPVSYFRFHGRNYETWFAEGRPSHERYDYLYDEEELRPWVERIREAAADAATKAVIAITNNHYRGQAAVNALQLKSWSRDAPVDVPEPLRRAYPEAIEPVARPGDGAPGGEPAPVQGDLFER